MSSRSHGRSVMKNQLLFTFALGWTLAIVFAWGIAVASAAQQQQAAPAQQQNAPAGNAANGRKLFVSFGCYQCHGYEAQGGSAGPRPPPRPVRHPRVGWEGRRTHHKRG